MPRYESDEGRCLDLVTKTLVEPFQELFAIEAMVLRAVFLDLDRPHQGGDAAGGLPIHIIHQTVQQAEYNRKTEEKCDDYFTGFFGL